MNRRVFCKTCGELGFITSNDLRCFEKEYICFAVGWHSNHGRASIWSAVTCRHDVVRYERHLLSRQSYFAIFCFNRHILLSRSTHTWFVRGFSLSGPSGQPVVTDVDRPLSPRDACLHFSRVEDSAFPTANRFSSKFLPTHALARSATEENTHNQHPVHEDTSRDSNTRTAASTDDSLLPSQIRTCCSYALLDASHFPPDLPRPTLQKSIFYFACAASSS